MNKQEQLKIDLRLAKELQVQIDRVSAELSAINESNFSLNEKLAGEPAHDKIVDKDGNVTDSRQFPDLYRPIVKMERTK